MLKLNDYVKVIYRNSSFAGYIGQVVRFENGNAIVRIDPLFYNDRVEGEFEFNEWKLRVIDEDTYKTLGEIA